MAPVGTPNIHTSVVNRPRARLTPRSSTVSSIGRAAIARTFRWLARSAFRPISRSCTICLIRTRPDQCNQRISAHLFHWNHPRTWTRGIHPNSALQGL